MARALVEMVVCRFGSPAPLHLDQGRNFQLRLFREVTGPPGDVADQNLCVKPQVRRVGGVV